MFSLNNKDPKNTGIPHSFESRHNEGLVEDISSVSMNATAMFNRLLKLNVTVFTDCKKANQ